MAISDYSTTASSNTAISGINIAENCPPSGINNAIRQLMADIKAGAADGSMVADDIVTTAKILDANVTLAKLADAIAQALIPTGAFLPHGGTTAPSGFLLCYGQNVSRTTYSNLFTSIGTTFGAGDGSTTFTIPDLRGRGIAGKDDMGGTSANRLTGLTNGVNGDTLGASGGVESHTLAATEMVDHKHLLFAAENAGTSGNTTVSVTNSQQVAAVGVSSSVTSYNITGTSTAATVGLTGNPSSAPNNAFNIVQPTLIANWIIKT